MTLRKPSPPRPATVTEADADKLADQLATAVTDPQRAYGEPLNIDLGALPAGAPAPAPVRDAAPRSRAEEPCGKRSISLPESMLEKMELAVFNNRRNKTGGHTTLSALIREALRKDGWGDGE